MKQLITIFLFIIAGATYAQTDSSKTKVPVTLSAEAFGFIAKNMGEWGIPNRMNLAYEVGRSMKRIQDSIKITHNIALTSPLTPALDSVFKRQPITKVVESAMIPNIYYQLSQLKEGIARRLNSEMKDALLPQIYQYSWIAARLMAIDAANAADEQRQIDTGINFLISIQQ